MPAVMLRLRVAVAVLVVAGACGGTTPVELRTAADTSAVVPVDLPRPEPRPWPTTTTITAPTTTTTAPPPVTTTTAPMRALSAPPAPPPAPRPAGGCLGWAEVVAAYFPPSEHATACRILDCETGGTGNPTLHNPSSSASGLWQFLDQTWVDVTGLAPPAADYSGERQTAAAAELWSTSGWGQWSCY